MLDPDRPLPPLTAIRAFEAAARLGGFARAAAELGTTAAAVSYHVRRLERQTGIALFVRQAQSVRLTETGVAIATECSRIFAALQATFAQAADTRSRRLCLSMLPTFGTSWLIPRLGRFQAARPDIAVEIDLSQTPHPLGEGRFDAAIRHGRGDWPGLRTVRLFPCVFQPLCAPALLPAAHALTDPATAPDPPLLGRPDWWTRWFAALGRGDIDLSGRFRTTLAAEHLDMAAAVAGQGIAIGSPILFGDELAAGRLVAAHDLIAGDGCDFWFVHPAAHADHPGVIAFRDWLTSEAEAALARLPGLRTAAQSVLSAAAP